MFDAFAEAGGNFIDTADAYTDGTSEEWIGDFLAERGDRDQFVIATKYTNTTQQGDPNASGNHRKNMLRAVDESLERLQTDYIDLYRLHIWDGLTPIEEVMHALDDLVRQGKIHYIGVSDTPAWLVSRANTLAELRGWTPFVETTIAYNVLERTPERDLLPMARSLDVGVTAWSPLGGGTLSGKYNSDVDSEGAEMSGDASRYEKADIEGSDNWGPTDENLSVVREVTAIADEIGCTPAQVAIAWLRQQPGQIIPIIGGTSREQIEENIGSLDVKLGEEHLQRLDELSRVSMGFPIDFMTRPSILDTVFGGTLDQIDAEFDPSIEAELKDFEKHNNPTHRN